jgi:hypothetical protein
MGAGGLLLRKLPTGRPACAEGLPALPAPACAAGLPAVFWAGAAGRPPRGRQASFGQADRRKLTIRRSLRFAKRTVCVT